MAIAADVPRKYQEEIFSRAQKENIIAAMNTGSGKTLISLLLIKWIAGQESHKGKVIVFLVPKVTLVKQQAVYLQQRLPSEFKVTMLHGTLELDLTDRKGWKKRIEGSGVLVMTAQIFVNILTHSLWSLNNVSLLIFDECHHARKNHPYNVIMREYAHAKGNSDVPKIFGMTASPTWDVKNPQTSMEELERNLDAKIIGVREHTEEMEEHSATPTEIIKLYPCPPEIHDYPYPTIHQAFSIIDIQTWDKLAVPWTTTEGRYHSTYNNLGLVPASMFLFQEIQYHVFAFIKENRHRVLQAIETNSDATTIDAEDEQDQPKPSTKPNIPEEFFLVVDILADFQSVFFPGDPSSSLELDLEKWSTPKVHTLIDLLLEHHTPTFQCIVFVEQRQTASTMARMLDLMPCVRGKIRCGHLVGTGVGTDGLSRQNDVSSRDVVQEFRDGKINTLIATSVAEEGLDFKECDLVIRFDGLPHNVSYVQSRGRARKQTSTFVVMIAEGDALQIARYESLRENEPVLKLAYQTRHLQAEGEGSVNPDDDDEGMDDTHPADFVIRDRHVEASGAILTYDNSLGLLNNLCALIPRDQYTAAHLPTYDYNYVALSTTMMADPSFDPYAIGYSVTATLPGALSLPRNELVIEGPVRRTKREAKRAVAWKAVRRLRELDVFDEHLYAVPLDDDDDDGTVGRLKASNADARKALEDTSAVMNVDVVSPWVIGQKLWIHVLLVDEVVAGGLVCSTAFPSLDIYLTGKRIRTLGPRVLPLVDGKAEKMAVMNEFTRRSVWLANTRKVLAPQMGFYFVPVTEDHQPDFPTMNRYLDNPHGCRDWTSIDERDYDNILVNNIHVAGHLFILRRIRHDLSPLSTPAPGSREAECDTYQAYWTKKWSWKSRLITAPEDGPLIEVVQANRNNSTGTSLASSEDEYHPLHTVEPGRLLPIKSCAWNVYPLALWNAYILIPEMVHQLTIRYRAQRLRTTLGLPPIPPPLLIEALTIPSSSRDYNNQRLETLGDAVLQVLTTVHLYTHYPNRHEGQLTRLRQRCVANRVLFQRARDIGLEKFVNTETPHNAKWQYGLPVDVKMYYEQGKRLCREVRRGVPRRSLQDSMEALLGASYLVGGMDGALKTASVLGMEVGVPVPWFMRQAEKKREGDELPMMFRGLEKNLGYKFKNSELLREALTHPSFASDGSSYQRLEFLGDGILDLVVADHLFHKFPSATSHHLSHARSKAICSPTLAHVAVRKLKLHHLLLVNSLDLTIAMELYVPIMESLSPRDVLRNGWRYDPPKALSDVFESVMGAVFVDTGYDFEKTAWIMRLAMEEMLEQLSPDLGLDPMSEVTLWLARSGCREYLRAEKRVKRTQTVDKEGIAMVLHDVVVVEPVTSSSLPVARFIAAEMALEVLKNEDSDKSLKKICVCALSNVAEDAIPDEAVDDLDTSMEEGTGRSGEDEENLDVDSDDEDFAGSKNEMDCDHEPVPEDTIGNWRYDDGMVLVEGSVDWLDQSKHRFNWFGQSTAPVLSHVSSLDVL